MIKKLVRAVLSIAGISTGVGFAFLLNSNIETDVLFAGTPIEAFAGIVLIIFMGLLFGLIFFILSPKIISIGMKLAKTTESELAKVPTSQIILGVVGLTIGLIIAYLISALVKVVISIGFISDLIAVFLYIFLGYLGTRLATRKLGEIDTLPDLFRKINVSAKDNKETEGGAIPKVLDTSVIIDGRIADICKTRFVEGPIIIPEFVLEELRHIADSSDGLKRNRGRRGLDILNIIQKELDVEVKIVDTDFPDVSEVDIKLIKLAQSLNGMVVTNDYNLNKVSDLHGVFVLNINELANAVKPVVLPGEEMTVQVVKEGKEMKQGVAYLDDGTMIVVESGRSYIGQTIMVVVTSVLQTAAGRMIFAKPRNGSGDK